MDKEKKYVIPGQMRLSCVKNVEGKRKILYNKWYQNMILWEKNFRS